MDAWSRMGQRADSHILITGAVKASRPCWQCSGVCFQATQQPLVPLLEGAVPPALLFDLRSTPVWSDAEWEAATPIGRVARGGEQSWIEVRRDGARWLYRVPWAGDLCIESDKVAGCLLRPDARLSLEMEFLEQVLAIHLGGQGVPVFHAAAVELDGAAIALAGAPGSGKSSLLIGLVQAGCGFLSDDVIAVYGRDCLVYPGHLNVRLHADAAAVLLPPDKSRCISPWYDASKWVTDVGEWGRIQNTACPLAALYLVEPRSDRPVASVERIPPALAVRALVEAQLGLDIRPAPDRLAALSEIVKHVPVRRLAVPRSYASLPATCTMLMEDIRGSLLSRSS